MKSYATFQFCMPDGSIVKAVRHRNLDGSVGGWVAVNALVAPASHIDIDALVEPFSQVRDTAIVKTGEVVRSGTVRN